MADSLCTSNNKLNHIPMHSTAKHVDREDTFTGRPGSAVLLVEDSRAIASLLKCKIEAINGVHCHHAETLAATDALLQARADDFFVAVLDLNLPDAPHGEVVDLVQSHGIPVVILTSSVDEQTRAGFLARRVADYVSKNNLAGVDIVARLVERMHLNREACILVVDDAASQRAYLCGLLNAHGYRTLEAGDGREALAVLKDHPGIRLVVTDYNMPGMDGLSMVQEVRRTHSPEALGIIGVSGAMDKGILASFLKTGANDFLTKPFETEEFVCLQVIEADADPLSCLEALRAEIEAIELRGPAGERVPLTVSIGATTRPLDSIDAMLGLADQAVYQAKEQGRNRVILLDRPGEGPGASTQVRARAR